MLASQLAHRECGCCVRVCVTVKQRLGFVYQPAPSRPLRSAPVLSHRSPYPPNEGPRGGGAGGTRGGGVDRSDAIKAMGLATLLTGLVLAQPPGLGEEAAAAMRKDDPMLMGPSGGRGYMTWRKYSEVEGRAKDQNKNQVERQRTARVVNGAAAVRDGRFF